MCVICRQQPLETDELNISGCQQVTSRQLEEYVKSYPNIKTLDCSRCPKIVNLPNLEGLKRLDCWDCPIVNLPTSLEGLKYLNCTGCPKLVNLPTSLEGLEELYCSYCPIVNLPNLEGLKILDCSFCCKLVNLPNLKGLKELYCWDCPKLVVNLPNLEGLKKLDCSGCHWLEEENRDKVKKAQEIVRNKITSRKLISIRNQLVPIYYHPEMKGGYFAKKDLENFVGDM